MPKLRSMAANRVRRLFQETDLAERPADLIADIIHYCAVEGIEFATELDVAEQYVSEELSTDNEIK